MREAQIASFEVQLAEFMQAKRFEECGALNERIDRMKNAQTEISRLQTELHGAMAARDFKACSEIQGDIDMLQETFKASKVCLQITRSTEFLTCRWCSCWLEQVGPGQAPDSQGMSASEQFTDHKAVGQSAGELSIEGSISANVSDHKFK